MSSSVYVIGFILLVFILKVESTHYAYTYDDGIGDDEQCCLVRVGEKFCLAQPITRSLLQVNKKCQRFDGDGKKNYLNHIVHRLDIETSEKAGSTILIQLKAPLEKKFLKNDLICLSPEKHNHIDLEKCYIELAAVKEKKHKLKNNTNGKATNDIVAEPVVEEKSEDENKIQQLKVTEPVHIREGHGLSVHETHKLNFTDFNLTTSEQRRCWTWYRAHTNKIYNDPTKFKKICVPLSKEGEKCLENFLNKKSNDNEQEESNTKHSITFGSKLYCENNHKQNKYLGYHYHSNICFGIQDQIYIEHKFSDIVSLSDIKKNNHVLQFISNNTKLTNEFESDCNDKTTLDDIKKSLGKQDKPTVIVGDL